MSRNILFITGTRADYGKLKPLIRQVESSPGFAAWIFVSGMHLIEGFGYTYHEVLKDGFLHVHVAHDLEHTSNMSINLAKTIESLTNYVEEKRPDMIIVHGDRIDALAGAIVGALNNILVGHIEGGEVSGTIDESIRHAVSKLAHIHFVSNDEAKKRLIQLGERRDSVYVLGSPDIDIMVSGNLPSLDEAKQRYGIAFDRYALCIYHPVTTEVALLREQIKVFVDALIESEKNYIIIYPNNDTGSDIILSEYHRITGHCRFLLFPSLRFEHFLTLLRGSEFMIGNSSAGVRETSVYGIPSIDVGSRQCGRYDTKKVCNIQHVEVSRDAILAAIGRVNDYRRQGMFFGNGNSAQRFVQIISEEQIWQGTLQKQFIDLEGTF